MTSNLTIALLSLLVLILPVRAQNVESARGFVQQVYGDYANRDVHHLEQRQAKFYTPKLYSLILADRSGNPGYVGNLDGDPICDCQDPGDPGQLKVESITFSASSQGRLKADVAFLIVREPRKVTLLLLKTPAGWRIDDIMTKDMPSLRVFLQGGKKVPGS
jgi:hypothetical protein